MRHICVTGETLPDAYHEALLSLYKYGEFSDCADWDTTQKEVSMTMRVNHPLSEPRISKLFIGGPKELEQYRLEMLDGILDFEVQKGNWEYTYHQRMGNQIQFVIDELKRNPSSRRAVICIRTPDDIGSDDPACFCAGTKINTPNGCESIEDISDGDIVYAYDFNADIYVPSKVTDCFSTESHCVEISTCFGTFQVSNDQLMYTKDGWKKACELTSNSCVLYSDINAKDDFSIWHLIGCLHGDGWISTPKLHGRNSIRKDIWMSVHYRSIPHNVEMMFKCFTKNKVSSVEKVVNSAMVHGNHITKKYVVSDAKLHDMLSKLVPCGRKTDGNMLFSADELSEKEIVDFLTGIFSSEGSVTRRSGRAKHIPFICIGMVWKECMDEISKMLSMLGIKHSRYGYGKIHKINIDSLDGLLAFIKSGIDFRFDSRKQIKFLNLTYVCQKTKASGEKYNGNIKWGREALEVIGNCLFVPIESVTDIGVHTVYDFTIEHSDHAVIANHFIAHNCIQHIQYFIRNDALDCYVLFRSNDACKATFMNAYALICLQEWIAKELGVPVGYYNHTANSFHCYEKDFDLLRGYAKRIDDTKDKEDLCYYYEDDWEEQMEAFRPEIMEQVNILKNR